MGSGVERAGRVRPKRTIAVLGLLHPDHVAGFEYDLQTRSRWSVEDILLERMSWATAQALADGFLRDPYSHSTAAVNGWAFVPAPEDASFLNWVDATAQMHHRPGKVKPQPMKRPWEHGQRPKTVVAVDPGRDERRAKLRDRLGLKF